MFADPTNVEGRAAWWSFAYALRIAAGVHLDIDPSELQAGFRARHDGTRVIGEAFLSDSLDNGAGYCSKLAQPDQIEALLSQLNPQIEGSMANKWVSLVDDEGIGGHGAQCDSSCHRCLRDYYNSGYHGVLDWRLAVDMASIITDPSARITLESPAPTGQNHWSQLVHGNTSPVSTTLKSLNYEPHPQGFQSLSTYYRKANKNLLVERHPLWDQHPQWQSAMSDALIEFPGYVVRDLNPFIALRRISDYV